MNWPFKRIRSSTIVFNRIRRIRNPLMQTFSVIVSGGQTISVPRFLDGDDPKKGNLRTTNSWTPVIRRH
jgi:hypothetical protein